MTREGAPHASQHADTEVFYMAGRQLDSLGPRLLAAGWPEQTAVCVVSRAGWPDQRVSAHALRDLAAAAASHAGRPSVVMVGTGASELAVTAKTVTGDRAPSLVKTRTS